jgi:response regulator of citrate/malate metabolism
MNLKYSILWFDDNDSYFDSLDLDDLKEEIRSWGFLPNIVTVTTSEMFWSHNPFDKFDLIIVDQRLEDYGEGQEFISQLRDNHVYTEVIFYTAGIAEQLWDAIREKKLEGVYVSGKDPIPKIKKVGYQAIKKVLDLENMRGIVMAEVGELDQVLDDIFAAGIPGLNPETRETIFKQFYQNASQQAEKSQKKLECSRENSTVECLLGFCDSHKRWQNFKQLLNYHEAIKDKKGRVGNYVKDVLTPRNFLAHGRPEQNQGGGFKFLYLGKEYIFDEDESRNLRQRILGYQDLFNRILNTLRRSQLSN